MFRCLILAYVSKPKKQIETVTQTALLRGINPAAWNHIKAAAQLQGKTLTAFVQGAAYQQAITVLQEVR